METFMTEMGIVLLCLLGGSYVIMWMISLLDYVSTLL